MDRYRAKLNTIDKLHPETTTPHYVQPDAVVRRSILQTEEWADTTCILFIHPVEEILAQGAKYTLIRQNPLGTLNWP